MIGISSNTPPHQAVGRRFKLALLPLLAIGVSAGVSQGQAITAVVNAASGMIQGLPNSGIAQGAIFLIVGNNLGPTSVAIANPAFQTTNLGGTSVSVTVGTTTVNAPLYYAFSTQVAALLPSNTPTGSGTVTVNYNGGSTSVPMSIVQNNLGIFTYSEDGQGVAEVTFQDFSLVSSVPGTGALGGGGPYTYGGAANPKDTLTLWGTGLGPVNGSDAAGAGLGVNMPNVPLKVWVGGISATITYQGRSLAIGEDQVTFIVPAGAPTGCAVPLAVQIGTLVSNFTSIPIANGSRSCTMQSPAFSAAAQKALTTSTGPVNFASFSLGRQIGMENSSGTTYADVGQANFAQVALNYGYLTDTRPVVLSSLDLPPLGTCTTSNGNASAQPLFSVITGLDAGAITVTGPPPDFPVVMKEQRGIGQATIYSATFSSTGVYFSGGAYTIAAAGGADVKSFAIPYTITQTPSWPSNDQFRISNGGGVTRANGVAINWNAGSSADSYWVAITGSGVAAATDTVNGGISASFYCLAPATAGSFTIPPAVLLTLPGGVTGELDFKPTLIPFGFAASGLDVGILSFQYDTSFFVPLN
jgi:uncharacterized protein (TIGR03437 family)